MGEKTGWTYFVIPAKISQKIKPGQKATYRVKGFIDKLKLTGVAMIPFGGGDYLIPVNSGMRKFLRKEKGDEVVVKLEEDKKGLPLHPALMACLADEPEALKFFKSLSLSHKNYFSKWVTAPKTEHTQAKRIAQAINALARGMDFIKMMREKNVDVWWR